LSEECDKKCDKNPPVTAGADIIDRSTRKGINKFRVFNVAGGIRLTGSSVIAIFEYYQPAQAFRWNPSFEKSVIIPQGA
jgi:hypothetical protein